MREKLFFNGLNELRAFAALVVIIHHIELYKNELGVASLYDFSFFYFFIDNLGKNGVYLFFTLSGFLITYLLLEEKSRTGKIAITDFYKRRILRIWPLYFIIIAIGFFLIPLLYTIFPFFFEGQTSWNQKVDELVYGKNLLFFLFFLSNIAMSVYGPVVGSSQSWSVSVEEQFYIIWPWIVKFFSKTLWIILVLIIVGMNGLKYKIHFFDSFPLVKVFVQTFAIDFMAMGGLFAIIYKKHKEIVQKIITNKISVFLIGLSAIGHLFCKISQITLALSFALLILMFIENKVKIKLFSNLGKWSYGIYMYHPMMMYFSFSLINKLEIRSVFASNLAYYSLIIGSTVLFSYFSYKYIELFFLKLKHRFSPIISGKL